jgi:membrane protein
MRKKCAEMELKMTILISFYKIIRAFLHKVRDDYVSAFSTQAAFYILISFFPFIMFLLTLIQYLPMTQETLLSILVNIFPSSVDSLVSSIVYEIFDMASGTVISITAISALWSSSKGIYSIIKGLNAVYGIRESRGYIRVRILSTIYTLIFAMMILVSLIILVFGNQLYLWIETKIPILADLALLIISIRTFVGLLILTLFFLLIYIKVPNRKSVFYKELPGSIVSAAGWMGFSYLYSFYIDNMGNYSNTYGSLTAIVLFMLWIYFCMYILFIGGEINVVLSSGDIVYYIKYMFKNRKVLEKKKVSLTLRTLKIQEDETDPLNHIIDKTMGDNSSDKN